MDGQTYTIQVIPKDQFTYSALFNSQKSLTQYGMNYEAAKM